MLNTPAIAGLLEALPSASALLDRDFHLLATNHRWQTQVDITDEQPSGKREFGPLPGTSIDWRSLHRRALDGETIRLSAEPFSRPDGTTDYIDWIMAPWLIDGTSPVGVVIHANVVTAQQHIRRRLDEDEFFIRTLFEQSPIGMNLCRMDGLWLESNPAFLELIGYTKAEADGGLSYWDLTPKEYAAAEMEQLRQLETKGRYGPYEKEFIRKSGERLPVRLNGFIVERGGERFIWSLIEDMTEQQQLRTDLESQRLKSIQASKLAAIGEMAAGIAHEINNPLQIIDSLAYRGERLVDGNKTVTRESFSDIRAAAARASHIVRSLLKFAREHHGDVGEHAVEDIAKEALNYTAARMRSHGIDIDFELDTAGTVRCGFVETTQVLINLLNNAFDAVIPEGGRVELKVERTGDEVVFKVIDTGPGVDEAIGDRLFEPFATTKTDGTGLGLSVSRGLIEAMEGTLTYTRNDAMSHFVVRLPAGSKQ